MRLALLATACLVPFATISQAQPRPQGYTPPPAAKFTTGSSTMQTPSSPYAPAPPPNAYAPPGIQAPTGSAGQANPQPVTPVVPLPASKPAPKASPPKFGRF